MSVLSSTRRRRLIRASVRARDARPPRFSPRLERVLRPVDGEPEAEFELALLLLRTRARRNDLFGAGLFSDPAWEILLDLYIHDRSGLPVAVSSLCPESTIPRTTILRWVSTLCDKGLTERRADPNDGRRVMVTLTRDGRRRMDRFLREALQSCDEKER